MPITLEVLTSLELMLKNIRKKLLFSLFLSASASVMVVSTSVRSASLLSGGGVVCEPQTTSSQLFSFRCSLVGQILHEFAPDRFGGVLKLTQAGNSPVEVVMDSAGGGSGGAKIVNGAVQLLDGAGQVTHENLSARDTSSYPNRASSVAVVGEMSPNTALSIDLKSPVPEASSGRAIVVGNADIINLDISGKDGLSGRSVEVAAAMQVLKGELGSSDELKDLARTKMGLSGSLSTPSVDLKDLTGSVGTCEGFTGRELKSFSYAGDDRDAEGVSTTVYAGREIVAARNVCERQVSEEFSLQTVCARAPEISIKVRCDYPDLVRYTQKYARPREYKKTAFSCAQSVPEGSWKTICAKEQTAVVASLVRPEYIALRPSKYIESGMEATLLHAYEDQNTAKKCHVDAPAFWDLGVSEQGIYDNYVFSDSAANPGMKIFDYGFTKEISRPAGLPAGCVFRPFNKMEKLMATGAMVFKQPEQPVYMPGTAAEPTDIPTLQRLNYWAGQDKIATDNLSATAKNAVFASIDPATVPSGSVKETRKKYFEELTNLGFEYPQFTDATISYEDLEVERRQVNVSLVDAICADAAGTGIKAAGVYRTVDRDAATGRAICDAIIKKMGVADTKGAIDALRFREKITYTFTGLRSGLALKRKLTSFGQTIYQRGETKEAVSLWPRALLLAGDLGIKPITKVTYCKELEIDNDQVLLKSGEITQFVSPERLSGAGIATYKTYFGSRSQKHIAPQMTQAQGRFPTLPKEASLQKAPSKILYGFSQSFVKVTPVSLRSKDCEEVEVSHVLSDHEKKNLNGIKNGAAVLITSEDQTITVYFSPFLVPRQNKLAIVPESGLFINTGLAPGIMLPEVSVAPAKLVANTLQQEVNNAFNFDNGYGAPKRIDLDRADWWKNNSADVTSTLEADFDHGVSFLQIPNETADGTTTYGTQTIIKNFNADKSRTLSGALAIDSNASRDIAPSSQSGELLHKAQRLIKTLRRYHLGVSFNGTTPQSTPAATDKRNEKTYPGVILGTSLGIASPSETPTKTCGPGSLERVENFKFPTKLITRKIEPRLSLNKNNFGQDYEPNLVNDPEVVTGLKVGYNRPPGTANLYPYFSRAFLPTTAIASGNMKSPDEPINIAQDKNYFYAQTQTLSGVRYQTVDKIGTFSIRNSSDQQYIKIPYISRMKKRYTEALYREIGSRPRYLPRLDSYRRISGSLGLTGTEFRPSLFPDTNNYITDGRARLPILNEAACVREHPLDGANPVDFCLEFDEGDVSRRYQPPHMFRRLDDVKSHTFSLLKNCSCITYSVETAPFGKIYTPSSSCAVDQVRSCDIISNTIEVILGTSPSPFYAVRPWKMIYRGKIDETEKLGFNALGDNDAFKVSRIRSWTDGESSAPELDVTRGTGSEGSLHQNDWQKSENAANLNQDYFSGQFLPLFRTDKRVFFPGNTSGQNGGEAIQNIKTLALTTVKGFNEENFFRKDNSAPLSIDVDMPTDKALSLSLSGTDQTMTLGPSALDSNFNFTDDNYGGGLYLPAITGTARVRFGRFITSDNIVSKVSNERDKISPGGWTDLWEGGDHLRQNTAAFGLFYGADPNYPHSYTSDPSGIPDGYNPRYGVPQTEVNLPPDGLKGAPIVESPHNTSAGGYSGHMFTECGDNLDIDTKITASYQPILNNEIAADAQDLMITSDSKFPVGLRLSAFGGFYYGPLAGEDLLPIEGKEDGLNNALYLGNRAYVDQKRADFAVPVYTAGSRVDTIIKATQKTSIKPAIQNQPVRVMKTVGRIIKDAKDDLSLANMTNIPKYQYEPHIALVPEVLAAMFLHSDFGDLAAVAGPIHPFGTLGVNTTKPEYASDTFGSFIGTTLKNELEVSLFRNQFTVGPDLDSSINAVQSTVLTFNDYVGSYSLKDLPPATPPVPSVKKSVPTFRLAWELTNESLFASVASYNVATKPSAQTGSVFEGGAAIQSLGSGAAIVYGTGIYGDHEDETAAALDGGVGANQRPVRRQGLELASVRNKPVKATKISTVVIDNNGGEETNFPIESAIYLEETPTTRSTGYFFADAVCGYNRDDFISSRKSITAPATAVAGTTIQVFDKVCTAAAVRGKTTTTTSCFSGKCNINDPFNANNEPAAANLKLVTSAATFTARNVINNVYWEILKNDVETTSLINRSPSEPPSCSAGFKLVQQIYEAEIDATKTKSFNIESPDSADWEAFDLNGEPVCPKCTNANDCILNEPFVEVARSYTNLFTNTDLCYDINTGVTIPDTRTSANRANPICSAPSAPCVSPLGLPLPQHLTRDACLGAGASWAYPSGYSHQGVIFWASAIEVEQTAFIEDGQIAPASQGLPLVSSYSIYQGAVPFSRRTIEELLPSAATLTLAGVSGAVYDPEFELYWVKQGTLITTPQCRALPYTPEGVIEIGSEGLPLLRARSSYTERLSRYGALDNYRARTKSKQVRLPVSSQTTGADQALLSMADVCDFGAVESDTQDTYIRPDINEAVLTAGVGVQPQLTDMNYAVDFFVVKGATSGLTLRQYTPWSTERTDSSLGLPVLCSIFDNEDEISHEKVFSALSSSLDEDRIFEVGTGARATRFAIGLPSAPDSSVSPEGLVKFITGGSWIPVGTEEKNITAADAVPVTCNIKIDSSFGPDRCDAPIPITYETSEGFNVVIHAEDGEHGGHAGSGIVLTSLPVKELNLKHGGGVGGASGTTSVTGLSGDRRLICYEKSKEVSNPWLRVYRFTKALINVSDGAAGNSGSGGADRIFYGWGVMPDANKFLQKELFERAKKEAAP